MIKLFLKGMILGLGKILPGVSGTVFAITLGMYDKCIYLVSHIKKEYKKAIKFLSPIFLGIITSIIFLSKMVIFLINNYYNEMLSFFIGILVQSSKEMYKKSKIDVKNNMKSFIISIIIFTLINYVNLKKLITIPNNIIGNLILGSIEAIASIIPGISGTSILILLNSYERVLINFSEVLNIKKFHETIYFFIPFGIGIVFNTIIISKIIDKLIKKYYQKTYTIIYGIITTSIFFLVLNIKTINIKNIIYFCTGLFFYKVINKYLSK